MAFAVAAFFGLILIAHGLSWLVHFYNDVRVGLAREKYNVPLPNAYAPAGHESAHEFNCVQRAHQNTLEMWAPVQVLMMLVGLQVPVFAGVLGVIFAVARVIYSEGYIRGGPSARHAGTLITHIADFPLLVTVFWQGYLMEVAPEGYGYVLIAHGLSWLVHLYMDIKVVLARSTYDVQYPNAYAPEGHPNREAFNCVQRAHQNTLEVWAPTQILMALAGLQAPTTAGVLGIVWAAGRLLYGELYARGGPSKRHLGTAMAAIALFPLLFMVFWHGVRMMLAGEAYGLVFVACGLSWFVHFYLNVKVLLARRAFAVPYPNLYAPDSNPQAYEFNCVQSAHQKTLEVWAPTQVLVLLVGLQYPISAGAAGIVWSFARVAYAEAYSRGGPNKHAGSSFLTHVLEATLIVAVFAVGYTMLSSGSAQAS